MLECLILIPFGSPVEPEVNKRQAARLALVSGSRPAVACTESSLCQCGILKFLSIFSLPGIIGVVVNSIDVDTTAERLILWKGWGACNARESNVGQAGLLLLG